MARLARLIRLRTPLGLMVAAALSFAIGPARADTDLPTVPADGFYELEPVPPGPAGALLRTQELFAPDGLRLWAILYRSVGLAGEPIAVSGLALAGDAVDGVAAEGRPILALAHGTTGLADICAPSRNLEHRVELVVAGIPAATDGWVVVATDYAGLGTPGPHPYIDGPSEGRAVLHSIRAIQQLPDVAAGSIAALQGISQGGHATLWAAELAPTEAPDLRFVGAVAAAPAGDLLAIAELARASDGSAGSWRNIVAIASAWSEIYGLPIDGLLTTAGMDAAARLETECRPTPVGPPLRVDAAIEPDWQARLAANTPGWSAAGMPILYLQGTADEQIPLRSARATLERLCRVGSVIDYRELPGVGHAGSLYGADRLAQARGWLADRLSGTPATDSCAFAARRGQEP